MSHKVVYVLFVKFSRVITTNSEQMTLRISARLRTMAQLQSCPVSSSINSWPAVSCAALFMTDSEDSSDEEEENSASLEDGRPEQVDLRNFIIYSPEVEQQQQQPKQKAALLKQIPAPTAAPKLSGGLIKPTGHRPPGRPPSKTPGKRKHRAEHLREHRCEYCGRTFSRRWALKVHALGHTGDKPHKCSVCGRGFSRQSNLATHMRVHAGSKPFKCNLCGKKFSQSGSMTRHLNRTHIQWQRSTSY
uniref:Zinc finger protein n=2 Tax=Macrostomum lignano TaxID=282301 RepID=A0A1I8H3J2_9PLAT